MGGGGFGVQTGHLTRNDREPYPETTERENPQQNQVAYDHLLGPAPRAADVDDCLERANAQYMNKGSQFMRDGRGYSCQYAQIYFQRLMMQKRVLRERAAVRWPGVPGPPPHLPPDAAVARSFPGRAARTGSGLPWNPLPIRTERKPRPSPQPSRIPSDFLPWGMLGSPPLWMRSSPLSHSFGSPKQLHFSPS
uniref:Uncharacterized protein n=1 Tax=Tetraselmis sp. GSL018 TaxID=582737 RepID=A0A061QUM6_9CHLO